MAVHPDEPVNEHSDSLIGRLPTELAAQIFFNYLPYEPIADVFEDIEEKKHIEAVFNLGHVCRRWRNIAHSTPELWSILPVTITSGDSEAPVRLVEEWLVRSGGLPLFVSLYIDPSAWAEAQSKEIMSAVIPQAKRWKVASLEIPATWSQWMSEKLSNRSFDQLEHLIFGVTDLIDEDAVVHLNASPTRLTMKNTYLRQISIDFHRITHFSSPVFSVTLEECVHIFQNSPCLISCDISATGDFRDARSGVVENISLRTLSIRQCCLEFWDLFSFPLLKTLYIADPYHSEELEFWSHLRNFVRRSDCEIRDLTLCEDEVHQSEVVESLKLLPHLERLNLRGRVHFGSFFTLMDVATTSRTQDLLFMGKLQSLTCTVIDHDYDWTALTTFLTTMTSRQGRTLQSFHFLYLQAMGSTHSSNDVTLNSEMFSHIMNVLAGLDFRIYLDNETDGVEKLCSRFGLMQESVARY